MSELVHHDIALAIGGLAYQGWTDLNVGRSIDAASGDFRLRLASHERTGAEDWPIEDGAACEIRLAGQTLITGYIDSIERFIGPEERGIEVTGRDKSADLVDCSAVHPTGSWRGERLETIAAALAVPFGVTIAVTGDTGAPFTRFALQQGESVFAAIERLARYRGLALWSPGDGSLAIGNPDTGARTGRLVEGVNVLSCRASRDVSERFSEYIVKGQASGDDSRNGAAVAQVKGTAADPAVRRYRPLLLIGEEQSDAASLAKRAAWEASVRSGKAKPTSITTPGWLTDAGIAWAPGARSACSIPSCAVEGDMLVQRVELSRSDGAGTIARLEVVPPEAWTQLAEAEPVQA